MRFDSRAFGEGFFAREKGDVTAAEAAFANARTEQEQIVTHSPITDRPSSFLV